MLVLAMFVFSFGLVGVSTLPVDVPVVPQAEPAAAQQQCGPGETWYPWPVDGCLTTWVQPTCPAGQIWSPAGVNGSCVTETTDPNPPVQEPGNPGTVIETETTTTFFFTNNRDAIVTYQCAQAVCETPDGDVYQGDTYEVRCTQVQGFNDVDRQCFDGPCLPETPCNVVAPPGSTTTNVPIEYDPPTQDTYSLTICNAWGTGPETLIDEHGNALLIEGGLPNPNAGRTCPGTTPPDDPPTQPDPPDESDLGPPTTTTTLYVPPPPPGCNTGEHKDSGVGSCHTHPAPTTCATDYQAISADGLGHITATTNPCQSGYWVSTCLTPALGEHGHRYWNPTGDPWPSDALPYGTHGCACRKAGCHPWNGIK